MGVIPFFISLKASIIISYLIIVGGIMGEIKKDIKLCELKKKLGDDDFKIVIQCLKKKLSGNIKNRVV